MKQEVGEPLEDFTKRRADEAQGIARSEGYESADILLNAVKRLDDQIKKENNPESRNNLMIRRIRLHDLSVYAGNY